MMKRSSFGNKMRQSLSDITNSQSQEELNHLGSEQSEYVNRIIKENVALVKLLEERDKTIGLSRYELRNLREGIQKLKVQNWSLAQTNTQFFAEINLARNRVKALQHEVTCKNALLKAKCCEQEEVRFQTHNQERLDNENTESRNVLTSENELTSTDEESEKPFVPNNRRRFIRSKSLGTSSVHKTDAEKEKTDRKRRQLRRKSTRVRRSVEQEATENLFEIEDLELAMPNDGICQQENSTMASNNRKKKEEDLERRDVFTRYRDCIIGRSPVNRPVRRAAERIHSYKGSISQY